MPASLLTPPPHLGDIKASLPVESRPTANQDEQEGAQELGHQGPPQRPRRQPRQAQRVTHGSPSQRLARHSKCHERCDQRSCKLL